MQCPNCSAQVDDAAEDCLACGVIFAKWRERAELRKLTPEEAPSSRPISPPGAPVPPSGYALAVALGAMGAGLIAALFTVPSGQRVPSGAARLPGGFALIVPDGWSVEPGSCPAAGPACSAASISKAADPSAALLEASGGLPIALSATVFSAGPRALPAYDALLDSEYLGSWRSQVDPFTPGPRRWLKVDGLRAAFVTGSGTKHVHEEVRKPLLMKEEQAAAELRRRNPGASVITYQMQFSNKQGRYVPEVVVDPGQYRDADYSVALAALLVSARSHTLVIGCMVQDVRRADCDQALAEFSSAVRVLERPRRIDLWTGSPATVKP